MLLHHQQNQKFGQFVGVEYLGALIQCQKTQDISNDHSEAAITAHELGETYVAISKQFDIHYSTMRHEK